MNNRERFRQIMGFGSVDRYINSEIGIWEQTKDRWEDEGVPRGAIKDIIFLFDGDYFDLDVQRCIDIKVREPYPFRDKEIIRVENDHEIFIDELGRKRVGKISGRVRGMSSSMDRTIENPVRDKSDWDKWKKNFIGSYDKRYPENWTELVDELNDRDYIIFAPKFGQIGFYSFLRNLMGFEGLSYKLYDDQKFIEEILDFLAEYYIELMKDLVKKVDIEYFHYFEDMADKNNPFVSPIMFKKLFMPRYKRFNDFLRKNGIKHIIVDSDGNINPLVSLFLEAGINGIQPNEVNAGMDVVKLRKEYGKNLLLMGGVDKMALRKDKKAIEEEVKYRIGSIIEDGGYIPTVDHLVPPDVPLENFEYYMELKKKILGG